jgi:hypothetical protein
MGPSIMRRYLTPVTQLRWATAAGELRVEMGNRNTAGPDVLGCVRRIIENRNVG